jgi:outer membrane receptor protein involved in Fe transport
MSSIVTKGVFVFVFFLYLFPANGLAQEQQTISTKSNTGFQISGHVTDANQLLPVEFATVILTRNDTQFVKGGLTNAKGDFHLDALPLGQYQIRIKYTGFGPYKKDSILLNSLHPVQDLGEIHLKQAEKQLDAVTVTDVGNGSQMSLDKKVFVFENDINSKGGSAADVLKNIPSVSLDLDGNVLLRGSASISVLIDGRPNVMGGRSGFLEQIPASAIEKVEIISNPSAKYDPDGVSGIINIILKKNSTDGFSLAASVSYSTWIKGAAFVNAGYKKGKINLYGNYSYRYNQKWYDGYTLRNNKLGDTSFMSNQYSNGIRHIQTHLAKMGFEYNPDSLNLFSVSATASFESDRDQDHIRYEYIDKEGKLVTYGLRNMQGLDNISTYDISGTYRRSFAKTPAYFVFDVSSSANREQINDSIGQQNYDPSGRQQTVYPSAQLVDNARRLQNYQVKADYVLPVKTGKLEAGLKGNYRNIDNDFRSDTFSYPASMWYNNPVISNHFILNEKLISGYASWSQSIGNYGYGVGGRLEEYQRNAHMLTTNQSFPHSNFDFFPSGQVSYKPSTQTEYRLAYNRRVNRPSIRVLNPFADYTDPLNLRFGNPDLEPEYIQSLELSGLHYFKNMSLNMAMYYRHSLNSFQVFRANPDRYTGAVRSTYKNFNYTDTYGMEVTCKADPFKWLNLTGTLNGFELALNSNNIDPTLSVQGFSWMVRLRLQANIRKGFYIQMMSMYSSPIIVAQGRTKEQYNTDAGVRQDLLKGAASIALSVSDVFNTQYNGNVYSAPSFDQVYYKKRESRILSVTFSWRFGKTDSLKRKRLIEETPAPASPLDNE